MKNLLRLLPLLLVFLACEENDTEILETAVEPEMPAIIEEFGYILNDFNIVRDTIRPGDTFGAILDANGVSNRDIIEVATKFRDSFDVRRIVVGKPYLLLNSKDSINKTEVFIYQKK